MRYKNHLLLTGDYLITNEYGVAAIQKELLCLIREFHSFCENEGIEYCLYAGSCIGAVRHKGFIPWDDDMDVCMDRKNYEHLMRVAERMGNLVIVNNDWLPRVRKCDAKLVDGCLPTIDVFVIDNVPDGRVFCKIKILLLSMLQGMMKSNIDYTKYAVKYRPLLWVTHLAGRLVPKRITLRWYDSVSRISNGKTTERVHVSNDSYVGIRNLHPSFAFKDRLLVDFEDMRCYIPSGFDVYLRKVFGDYMVLPSEDDRGKIKHRGNAN